MKETKKRECNYDFKTKKLIIISIILVVLVIIAGLFYALKPNDSDQGIKDDHETIEDIKNSLGHGSNGDVIKIEEGTDKDNNRTYTFYKSNGDTNTITIRKITENESENTIIVDEDDDNSNIDSSVDNNSSQETDTSSLGTAYEKYNALSSDDKSAFYKSFDDPADFYEWISKAKDEYDKLYPTIYVGENEVIDYGNN